MKLILKEYSCLKSQTYELCKISFKIVHFEIKRKLS